MTSNSGATKFLDAVAVEFSKAQAKHSPINSAHEGYSVILEELDEFWAEVKKRRSQRDREAMYAELVQVAAMALRTAFDVVENMPEVTMAEHRG